MALDLIFPYVPPSLDVMRPGDREMKCSRQCERRGMTSETIKDNQAALRTEEGPDAHGQAALLLVESLIHALIAGAVITVQEAVEVVETAADVKQEIAESLGDSPDRLGQSLTLLQTISDSLKQDVPLG